MESRSNHRTALHISVSGFRSLQDFNIVLCPGLNLLVGPNGSGKSNFIEFLDFLYTLVRGGASIATSGAGGISRVFSQEILRHAVPKIRVSIKGIASLGDYRPNSRLSGYFKFNYDVEIRFHKQRSAVFISSEIVRLSRVKEDIQKAATSHFYNRLGLKRSLTDNGYSTSWFNSDDLNLENYSNPFFHLDSANSLKSFQDRISRFVEQYDVENLDPDKSLFSEFGSRTFPALTAVKMAIARGRSFNIIPDRVRALDDISRPPFIDRDGSGLSSALYEFQALRQFRPGRAFQSLTDADSQTLDTIVEWTKLVFPSLSNITVNSDVHLGKYVPYLLIDSSTPLKIPFSSCSDGTLKWLCLASLILSEAGTYTIEEPENYLHPKMQQHLIQLIREQMEMTGRNYNYLLSTHSETVIGQCMPHELIIFNLLAGKTVAKRPQNTEAIEREISHTGFGLGHYYVANAVS